MRGCAHVIVLCKQWWKSTKCAVETWSASALKCKACGLQSPSIRLFWAFLRWRWHPLRGTAGDVDRLNSVWAAEGAAHNNGPWSRAPRGERDHQAQQPKGSKELELRRRNGSFSVDGGHQESARASWTFNEPRWWYKLSSRKGEISQIARFSFKRYVQQYLMSRTLEEQGRIGFYDK